jgi:hypothetical protein
MNERVVVTQAASLQIADLAQPRVMKVTKPQADQSLTLDLGQDRGAKLDFSAVTNENMAFVREGTKLVIQFDNESTITADPFFNFSGRPLAHIDVELSAGHAISGEQFAQLFPIASVSLSQFDDDDILPSGAHFNDPFIDPFPDGSFGPLPHSSLSLASPGDALDGQAGLGNSFAAVGGVTPSQQIFSTPTPVVITNSVPGGIVIPAPGGAATQAFEAGLGTRNGEPAGSHTGNPLFPITTQPGSISFTSPPAKSRH